MSELKNIKDGFNAGYIIREKKPELYQQLVKAFGEVDLPFFKSFIDGGKQVSKEQIRHLMSKDSFSDYSNPDKNISKDFNKEDINPEMDI